MDAFEVLSFIPESRQRPYAKKLLEDSCKAIKDFKADDCAGKHTLEFEMLKVQLPGYLPFFDVKVCIKILGKKIVKSQLENAWGDYWERVKKGEWIVKGDD